MVLTSIRDIGWLPLECLEVQVSGHDQQDRQNHDDQDDNPSIAHDHQGYLA